MDKTWKPKVHLVFIFFLRFNLLIVSIKICRSVSSLCSIPIQAVSPRQTGETLICHHFNFFSFLVHFPHGTSPFTPSSRRTFQSFLNNAQSLVCHCPLTSITSSSSSSELLALLTFLPSTSTVPRRPSPEGEKEEGEEEEELEAAVDGNWERKLAPAGPGVAAGPGSPPGIMDPV